MNKTLNLFLTLTLSLFAGCGYSGISGKVIDGVTGNPLAGAIVLAQWTKTHGLPGLTSHTVYKIEETETDKEGIFSIGGAYSPFVEPPRMVIYKKGYVPWRNDMTFKKMEIYDDVIWQNNLTYKLEHWKDEYSKERLYDFLDTGLIGMDYANTPKFSNILSGISKEAQPERELKWRQKK
jgi:hypothetical protein